MNDDPVAHLEAAIFACGGRLATRGGACKFPRAATTAGCKIRCRFAVVLGDGEMQEGQIYEALMTMRTRRICNLTVFIDVNKYQSDNLCCDIKLLPDLPQLFASFGFTAIEINGNDTAAVVDAWQRAEGRLSAIIAHTTKPAGSKLMDTEMDAVGRSCQPWHTRVPSWQLCVSRHFPIDFA
jgi:transketolase